MPQNFIRKAISVCSALSLIAIILFAVYAWHSRLFTTQEDLQVYIAEFGAMGALVFILFQAIQVVVPIAPGGISSLAGVLLFGPWMGFLYNYIGLCLGSHAAFAIGRTYGKPVLYAIFNKKMIENYEEISTGNNSKFARWFAIAIFLPVAPDDLLCYLAGTTRMSWRQFTLIILLGKPASIALYSLGLNLILQRIITLVS